MLPAPILFRSPTAACGWWQRPVWWVGLQQCASQLVNKVKLKLGEVGEISTGTLESAVTQDASSHLKFIGLGDMDLSHFSIVGGGKVLGNVWCSLRAVATRVSAHAGPRAKATSNQWSALLNEGIDTLSLFLGGGNNALSQMTGILSHGASLYELPHLINIKCASFRSFPYPGNGSVKKRIYFAGLRRTAELLLDLQGDRVL